MIRLSKRLSCIASEVPSGSRLADIGSDHALLPVYLAERGHISFAIAGELNTGPYAAAIKQVQDSSMQQLIEVRQGDGLAVVSRGEANVISIAGMGGSLIASILSQGADKLQGVQKLILQPNVGEEIVRRWLVDHNWLLSGEHILEEDGKIYEIITAIADAGAMQQNDLLYHEHDICPGLPISPQYLLRMGPYLLKAASPILIKKWEMEIVKMERIHAQISTSSLPSAQRKLQELGEEIVRIREVLDCLQKQKR